MREDGGCKRAKGANKKSLSLIEANGCSFYCRSTQNLPPRNTNTWKMSLSNNYSLPKFFGKEFHSIQFASSASLEYCTRRIFIKLNKNINMNNAETATNDGNSNDFRMISLRRWSLACQLPTTHTAPCVVLNTLLCTVRQRQRKSGIKAKTRLKTQHTIQKKLISFVISFSTYYITIFVSRCNFLYE